MLVPLSVTTTGEEYTTTLLAKMYTLQLPMISFAIVRGAVRKCIYL